MLRPRKTINAAGARAMLDGAVAAVRREAEGPESDPFDDAVIAAVVGVAEAMRAEGDTLAEIEGRLRRLARRAMDSRR